MKKDSRPVISEEAAAEVWRRAAQLQAEAEQHMHALPAEVEAPEGGFPVAQVEAAAVEAGIAPEFVRRALAEVNAADAGASSGWLATAVAGKAPRYIQVARHFEASAPRVLGAVQRVLPAPPYRFSLAEASGDPVAGGVLTFQIPPGGLGVQDRLTATRAAAAESVQISIRPRETGCDVEMTALLRPGGSEPVALAGLLSGFGAAGGGLVTTVIGLAALGLAGSLALAMGRPGLVLGGGGGLAAYRVFYRSSMRRAAAELQAILATLEAHLRTGGAFVLPAESISAEGAAAAVAALTSLNGH